MDENNARVKHIDRGGVAAVLEDGWVSIIKGTWKIRIEKVVNIPLTLGGKAVFMIQNIPALYRCRIRAGLQSGRCQAGTQHLYPLTYHDTGRMNVPVQTL